jgi:glycerol-3-phosphate dehydrogenase
VNVSLALTAAANGASVANHVEVLQLLKDESNENKICGARLKDKMTGEEWNVKAKVVVNATGPFAGEKPINHHLPNEWQQHQNKRKRGLFLWC